MPVSFPCPKCRAVVKISSKIPKGTPVSCPSCTTVFANPAKGPQLAARYKRALAAAGARLTPSLGVRAKRFVLFLLFMVCLGALSGGAFLIFNRFGGGPGKGGAAQATANKGGGGGATKTAPGEEPLAYVPSNANWLVGFNAGSAHAQPALKALLEQSLTQLGLGKTLSNCKAATGLEFKEMFDQTIIARRLTDLEGGARPEHTTIVMRSSTPYDAKLVQQWASDMPPMQKKDKSYFEKHKEMGHLNTVFLATDRIVVLSDVVAGTWEALFTVDGSRPALPPDIVTLLRQVDKHPHWSMLAFEPKVREGAAAGKGPAELAVFSLGDSQMVFQKTIGEAKGLASWAASEGDKLLVAQAVICANADSAGELSASLDTSWAKSKEAKTKEIEGLEQLGKEMQAMFKEGLGTLQYAKQDTLATATVMLSATAAEQLAKARQVPEMFAMAGRPAGAAPKTVMPEEKTKDKEMVKDKEKDKDKEKAFTLSAEEQDLLNVINKLREESTKKVGPLKANPKLFEIARAYASTMAKAGKQADDLDGKNALVRVRDAGFKVKNINKEDWLAVNITSGPDLDTSGAFAEWNEDAGAKEFMLDQYEEVGIGIATNDKKIVYYYMIYAIQDK